MGPLEANTDTGRDGSSTGLAEPRRPFRFARAPEVERLDSRHEPQILAEQIVPRDAYAAWLEQREAEREREPRPEVRWVQRPRGEAAPAILARRL